MRDIDDMNGAGTDWNAHRLYVSNSFFWDVVLSFYLFIYFMHLGK